MRELSKGWTAAIAAVVVAVSATEAQAATIAVPAGDATALIAAITTANGTAEADTLNVSGTYSFSDAHNAWYGPNALPPITSDITIAGSASSGAVIQNTSGTRLRFFFVAGGRSGLAAGTLRLRNLELSGGRALGGSTAFGGAGAGMGGAIYNQGTLDLSGVTLVGNTASGGNAGTVNSNSGGGLGSDATSSAGGGFGGATPGASAGAGGNGAPAGSGGGGGGGGYGAGENGANGGAPAGGAGGGAATGHGGANSDGTRGGNGSGAGGQSRTGNGAGGAGGAFGAGGASAPSSAGNLGAGGGGGVGGGGGGTTPGFGGGSGGFGGGGGWANYGSGSGGFGGAGAGGDGRVAGAPAGKGGFGGGDGAPFSNGAIGVGGGGAAMGGAIFNDRATITATNSTFTSNAVAGGLSTMVFIGAGATAGVGGDGLGAAIFNLNGTLTLTHVTIAGNTATGGAGSTNGTGSGSLATVGYDSAVARTATTTVRQSIVTVAGASAAYTAVPTTLADGTTNASTVAQVLTGAAYVGATDPQVAALGGYGGPTRTMPPNPGSPVIGAATVQGLTTTDQRGFNRDSAADIGAVETQATTVTTDSKTLPYSASARNLALAATMSPARATNAGTLQFNAGALGTASAAIGGGAASGNLVIAAAAAPGNYTLTATAPATPGFAAGSGTATIKILAAPQVCKDVTGTTAFQAAITVNTDCTGAGPVTVATTNGAHGTVTVVAGALRYTPAAGYSGSDEFTYTTTNEGGASKTAKATIKVLAAPQVCKDVTGTTAFQTAITISTDCTGVTPVTVAKTDPAHGTVTVVAGALRYTPAAGYIGSDEFTYTTTNEGGASNGAKATVRVLAPPQVCKDVTGTTPFQTAITVNTDCAGAGPVTIATTNGAHGTVTVVAGALRYTPANGFAGDDEFTYTTTNEGGASNSAKATIKVLAAPQVCKDVTGTTAFQTAITISTDCTGATPVTVTKTDPSHGTVAVVAGALRYTPAAGYIGSDEFTYTTTNEGGASNTAKATIKVLAPPQVCKDATGTTPFQTAITVNTDCAGAGPVTIATTNGAHGTVTVVAGALRYTPASGFAGDDEFTYTTTNEGGASNTAKATIKVLNLPQVCKDVSGTTPYQTAITVDTDCTGATPVTVATTDAAHGTVTVVAGALRYTPAAGYIGSDEFTYTTTNEGGASNTAKATVKTLAPPPVCEELSATTAYETAVALDVDCTRAGAVSIAGTPAHGTAILAEGKLRYTPAAGFNGTDEFSYAVTNEGGTSDAATVKVTVNPPAPTCSAVKELAGAGRARTITLSCASIGAAEFAIVDSPTHGKLSALDDKAGTVDYTADDDYAGADTFTYRATNAGGDSELATVTVDVTARPSVRSTPSADVRLGGALTTTVAVDPRFEPAPGDTIELRLYRDECTGTPVFVSKVELDTDGTATSDEFAPTAAGVYYWQASYGGDAANLPATSTCDPVTVSAPPAVLRTAPAETPVRVCAAPVVLLDVSPVGKQARVSGIARRESAGQQVTILRAGKPVGAAKVGADGAFSATVGGPAAGEPAPVTYTVTLGSDRSRAFRYDRYVRITGRSGTKVSGKLYLKTKPKQVTVLRVNVCTNRSTSTKVKVDTNRRFTFTMRGPDAGSPYALYRVTAKQGANGKTYTTQLAIAG